MVRDRRYPNNVTFIWSLKACCAIMATLDGRLIHASILMQGLDLEHLVQNALLNMYMKCGSIYDGTHVFASMTVHDVVSWSTMIAGYVDHGQYEEALALYNKMQSEGVEPNEVTFACIVKACASLATLDEATAIYMQAVKQGFDRDQFVGNALIDMYLKHGSFDEGKCILQSLSTRDVISWNAMITGYTNFVCPEETLVLLKMMVEDAVEPNAITFSYILKVCLELATLSSTRLLHRELIKRGLEANMLIVNSLVDAYSKCGNLEDALKIFDTSLYRDLVSWNAVIAGHAEHGQFSMAVIYFNSMLLQGVQPDEFSFLSLLLGCSHAGLIHEGMYFLNILCEHGLPPTMDHYACVVDMCGRTGSVIEAENVMLRIPYQPDFTVWTALLGSCLKSGDMDLGKVCFSYIMELRSSDTASHVQISNIYAANHIDQQMHGQGRCKNLS